VGELVSVSENAGRHEDASELDTSSILKHGNTSDEMPSENNGEHVDATSAQADDSKNVVDGEQVGDDRDHHSASDPSYRNNPVNGESSEDVENDAVVLHDSSEGVNENETNAGALSCGEVDNDEAEVTNDGDKAAADAETEDRVGEEHLDEHDVEPRELSSEDVDDAAQASDVVDAPSPMDVDVAQSPSTGKTSSNAGCDGEMEVEYPTGVEGVPAAEDPSLASCALATDLVRDENERASPAPMAEDADDGRSQSDYRMTVQTASELEDAENITTHSAAVSDAAEYDEVDAPQSKGVGEGEVSEVDESGTGEGDGLVEGADFTVELQPDTSELEAAASEADQSVIESEVAEKTGTELESHGTEESDETSDNDKVAESDASTVLLPASSDTVCINRT